jgi:hypothetical protein
MEDGINRSVAEPPLVSPVRFSLTRMLTSPGVWYWAALVLSAAFFIQSLLSTGPIWDEVDEFRKLRLQLVYAGDVLSGAAGLSFHLLPSDTAFYGVGSVALPYYLSHRIDILWLKETVHSYQHSYSVLLHILTFLCAIAAADYTRRLVSLVTEDRDTGFLAGAMLLLTPFWIGYGFFDYKDIPVATGVIAATYYAAAYLKDGRSRTSLCFFLALVFLGTQKLAAIPLSLPACLAVLIAALRQPSVRRFAILTGQAAMCLFLLYLATPPAWLEPVAFAITSLDYMSQHEWGGCTLTAGECIGREVANGEGYSVPKYLGLWYGVKLPLLVWIGLIGSICVYCWSFRGFRSGHHLVVAALAWPILAISIRNSTLYDGVRHTLFLVPLAVATVFVIIPGTVWRRLAWGLACYFLFLAADSCTVQPYQYVWFNEAGRFYASEKNFETDYWGYSLREAVAHARTLQGPKDWIVAPTSDMNPSHLIEIFATERFSRDMERVPPGATYFVVKTTRTDSQAPADCGEVWYVTRRELLSPIPLRLALVAKCGGTSASTSR